MPKSLKLIAAAALLMAAAPFAARADAVMDWNAVGADLPIASPPVMARVMATMHAAVYDAVNSIDPRSEPYRFPVKAPAGASQDAAAATAAHEVLSAMVPAQKPAFDAALSSSLGKIPDGTPKADGIAVGKAVAAQTLAWRAKDGFNAKAADRPGTAPGAWQRTPPAMAPGALPHLGAVTPFVIASAADFEAKGRAALTSTAFARDVNEVHRLGGRFSKERTAEQTATAIFWAGNEVPVWNAAARAASQAKRLSLHENARLFALLHTAGADAIITGFRIKYAANDWRPITAIRNGASTGNPAVSAEANWEPLLVTPAHPEFPSGHCIYSGAAAQVLRTLLGSDELKLDYVYPAGVGTIRSYASFSQMEKEVEDARVWAGIHFRSTDEQSSELGRRVAAYAVANRMRPQQ